MSGTRGRVDVVSFRAKVWCTLAILMAVLYLWIEFLDEVSR